MKLEHELAGSAGRGLTVEFVVGGERGLTISSKDCYPALVVAWLDVPALIEMLRQAQRADGRTVT